MTKTVPQRLRALLISPGFWQAISLLVSIGLMIYILLQIDFTEFWGIATGIPLWGVIGAFIAYVLLNIFRAIRFRTFIPEPRPSFWEMIPIVLYHNFLTRVLPFKTGEISYVLLLKRHLNQPVSEGISSLLSARLFELGLVLLGGAFGLLSVTTGETGAHRWEYFIILIALLVVYAFLLYHSGAILRRMAKLWQRWAAPRLVRRFPKIEGRIEEKLHEFAEQFERIHDPRLLLSAVIFSVCTYSMSMLFDITLMRAMGITLDFGIIVAIISIKMFIEAAPIAVSGFGPIEVSWTFGLVTLGGFELETAAATGLFLHTAQVIVAGLLGVIGWFILSRSKTVIKTTQQQLIQ